MPPFSVSLMRPRSQGWTCSARVGFLKFKADIVDEKTEPKAEGGGGRGWDLIPALLSEMR